MPVFIDNEAAYEAAIARNIAENRRKTGERKFRAAFEDADAIIDFVESRVSDEQVTHYARTGHGKEGASFIDACWVGLKIFGGLTERQGLAVRNILAKSAERKAQYRAEALTKVHVGAVGERRDFDLTIKFVTSFETQFGTTFVNICEDADANVVVYKGSNLLGGKGEKVQVKATIKAHDYRDGVAQTIISRPKAK
jgi:(p)ppGpp synthase/HD superfamily hydrolase